MITGRVFNFPFEFIVFQSPILYILSELMKDICAFYRNSGVTDKTIKKYVDYLSQAFLIQLLTRHSFKSKERIRNQKAYIVDSGLLGNRDNALAPENIAWRLENVVYIELLRRCAHEYQDVFYYKPTPRAKEIVFVVCDQNKAVELIQVAYEIDSPKAFER